MGRLHPEPDAHRDAGRPEDTRTSDPPEPRSPAAGDAAERTSAPPSGRGSAAPNLATRATRGAIWTIATGIGARAVSLVGTLLITKYINPAEYGDVTNTFVFLSIIDLIAQAGLAQYVASQSKASPKALFHATFYYHLFGAIMLVVAFATARPLGPFFGSPNMELYLPGFAVAIVLLRAATIPDRILSRDLRFRTLGLIQGLAEIAYALSSLGLAMFAPKSPVVWLGVPLIFGGAFSIVWGNIFRGLVRVVTTFSVTRARDWATPFRIERSTSREVLGFGFPLMIASVASTLARRGDNLVMGHMYGDHTVGLYNFAYNLADVPPSVIGERLGDVLVPTYAKVEPSARPRALVRAVGLASLVCFPIGIGLSAVAPSLAWVLRNETWRPALVMLMLLGSLSIARPVTGVVFSYLQVLGKTRLLMWLEWLKAVGITVGIYVVGQAIRRQAPAQDDVWGPLAGCVAVGVAQILSAYTYMLAGAAAASIRVTALLAPSLRVLVACAPMVLAVFGIRALFPAGSVALEIASLLAQIVVGALAFVASAWIVARALSKDFLELLLGALRRRRAKHAG